MLNVDGFRGIPSTYNDNLFPDYEHESPESSFFSPAVRQISVKELPSGESKEIQISNDSKHPKLTTRVLPRLLYLIINVGLTRCNN